MKNMFYGFQRLPQHLGMKQAKCNTDGERIQLRDGIRWRNVRNYEKFGEYKHKESTDNDAQWKVV